MSVAQHNVGTKRHLLTDGGKTLRMFAVSTVSRWVRNLQQNTEATACEEDNRHVEVLKAKQIVYIPIVISKFCGWKATNIQCWIPEPGSSFHRQLLLHRRSVCEPATRCFLSQPSSLFTLINHPVKHFDKTVAVSADWLQLLVSTGALWSISTGSDTPNFRAKWRWRC